VRRGFALLAGALALALVAGGVYLALGGRDDSPQERPAPAERPPPGERIRVEVLNAAGVPGIAREATRTLRDADFDVVYFGNAPTFALDSSVVIARSGGEEDARRVARVLRIPRVEARPDTALYLEVTVILARDWVGIPPGALD